jgi:Rps23 Pro-64 3,4-dihydroxylase Tpa1-like proline 4-hydroxylase
MPPHATFTDILSPAEHDGLLAWVLAHEAALKPATFVGGVYDPRQRLSRSLPRSRNGPWQVPLRERVAELFPELLRAAKTKPFELAEIDLKLVAYGDGDFIAAHSDTVTGSRRGNTDRILAAIYYFHREPKGYSGGELRLYPFGAAGAETDPFDAVEPRRNSLTVFPAWAMHSVTPVSVPSRRYEDSRFAVNCWLNRPAD